jgi:hypothetical protein
MKKIFAILVCAFILCAMPIMAYAEDVSTAPVDTEAIVTEEQTTSVDTTAVEITATEEVVTDTNVGDTETEAVTEATPEEPSVLTTDQIVKWVEGHLEEVIVVVTTAIMAVYQGISKLSLNKSVALCNNNAVAIVETNNLAIHSALAEVEKVSAVVESYKQEIASLLAEIRQSDEEKKRLETAFDELENYLRKSKLANIELANEVAELLVLANIPNSKKEELYSRHRAAVEEIAAVDIKTEVTTNVGEEA